PPARLGSAAAMVHGNTRPEDQQCRYQGEQKDSNGYIYPRARYYDPSVGRFLSKDPLPGAVWDPGSQNAYAYAGNNPVTHADPTGMDSTIVGRCLITPQLCPDLAGGFTGGPPDVAGTIGGALWLLWMAVHHGDGDSGNPAGASIGSGGNTAT